MLRATNPPANWMSVMHWGDMAAAGPDAATIVAPFPPADGSNAAYFRSLSGGPYFQTGNVYPAPSIANYQWVAEKLFRDQTSGQNQWFIRTDCNDHWSPRYPLNMDMKYGPAAGDYAPKSLDLVKSSSPMSTQLGQAYGWPTSLAERPLLGENVDLITGVPLVQETDFELPFGTAVFRWRRTFAEITHARHEYDTVPNYQSGRMHAFTPSAQWWDWVGQGWMLGASPLLLIDSTTWGSVHPLGEERCYFLPDAHHAVPFVLQGYSPQSQEPRVYTAPPRFGMVLGHNGQGTVGGGWTQKPTEWYIWTHQRSLRYTFKPVYDDVGQMSQLSNNAPIPLQWDSENNKPMENEGGVSGRMDMPLMFPSGFKWGTASGNGSSLGTPYYAVLIAIDDLNGNRVELEYTPFIREPLQLQAGELPVAEGCVEMVQRSQHKGQVKRILLKFGTNTQSPTVAWTIVPVYRAFGGSNTEYEMHSFTYGPGSPPAVGFEGSGIYPVIGRVAPAERFENQHAVDTVLVYRDEYAPPVNAQGRNPFDLTIPHSYFDEIGEEVEGPNPITRLSAVQQVATDVDAVTLCQLDPNWVYKVRYIYADGTATYREKCALLDYKARSFGDKPAGFWGDKAPPLESPRLLLATTTHRQGTGTAQVLRESHRMYRYLAHNTVGNMGYLNDYWSLQGMWSPGQLDSIRAVIAARDEWDQREAVLENWPYSLVMLRELDPSGLDHLPVVPGPGEDEDITKPMLATADQAFEPWDSDEAGFSKHDMGSPNISAVPSTGDCMQFELHRYVKPYIDQGGVDRVPILTRDGVAIYSDRSGSSEGSVYRVYRFLLAPKQYLHSLSVPGIQLYHIPASTVHEVPVMGWHFNAFRFHQHHPYRIMPFTASQGWIDNSIAHPTALGDPVWAVVIDSHRTWGDASWRDVNTGLIEGWPVWPSVEQLLAHEDPAIRSKAPTARRLVIMNPTGHIMYERRWDFTGGMAPVSSGLWEERVYDWQEPSSGSSIGRLLQVRTVGWAAATDKVNDGLIRVFAYEPNSDSMEVAAVGNKQGTGTSWNTDVAWQKQLIRDPVRREMVKYEVTFDTPSASLYPWNHTFSREDIQNPAAGTNITYRGYAYENVPQPEGPDDKRIKREVTIRPPVADVGGTDRFPVEVVEFDFHRRPFTDTWRGYGEFLGGSVDSLLAGTVVVNVGDVFYMDLQRSDFMGRSVLSCTDAGPSFSSIPSYFHPATGVDSIPPDHPDGWVRQAPTTPLHAWVATDFEELGPWRVENHLKMGEFYVRQHEPHPRPEFGAELALATRVYKHAEFNEHGHVVKLHGPGQISFNGRGGLEAHYGWSDHPQVQHVDLLSQEVEWTSTWVQLPSGAETYTVIRSLDLKTNGDGSPTNIAVTPAGSSETRSVHIAYTDLGEVQRQRHVDGTITRHVHDPIGKLLRTYRGTNDTHWHWGAIPAPADPCAGTNYADNLILVEKRDYGTSSHDALQLTSVRAYRNKPTDQYHNCGTNNEDLIGWKTTHTYDWKMRRVITSNHGEGANPPPYLHTITYFDAADRVRFTAVFAGDNLPSGAPANPADAGYLTGAPAATDILAAEPLRLTETVYNRRGLVEHQRDYDPTVTDGSAYVVTSTHYDFADRPVRVIHPNGREQRTVYDATGKQTSTNTYAAGYEQSRAEFSYDSLGRIASVTTFERVDPTGQTLGNANSVASRQYKWHDSQGRLTAVADLGTGSRHESAPSGMSGAYANYMNGTDPVFISRPTLSPHAEYNSSSGLFESVDRQGLPAWVKITCYEYDEQGRESVVINPAGSVTRKYYNAFGELTRQVDNADETATINDARRRVTLYKYDLGRLIKIAALLDENDINWESNSGSVQVTELFYGAEVVDSNGNSFTPNPSYHNGWVGEVRFPDPTTGQPSVNNRLRFKYFITGEIAQRIDQRGVIIKYTYDTAGRMTRYTIDTSSLQEPPGGFPLDRVHQVDLEYSTLGQLKKATAWKSPEAGDPDLIAEAAFDYDQHGNLLYDRQQHGGYATATSPSVDYSWTWTPATATSAVKNLNRLATMSYPDRDPGTPVARRTLTFEYGTNSTQQQVDDALCRMTGILSNGGFGSAAVARYEYSGQGRRIGTRLGDNLTAATFASKQAAKSSSFGYVGFDAFDTFGRPWDTHSTDASGTTQHRAQYSYDANDNPLSVRIKQAVWGGQSRDNTRSFKYDYDKLDRLIKSDTGTLNNDDTAIVPDGTGGAVMPVLSSWGLSRIDNWNGVGSQPGLKREGNLEGNGVWTAKSVNHATSQTNQITSVSTSTDGSPIVTNVYHDKAGNLIADHNYYYLYDGLNRLVQVCERGTLEFDPAYEDPVTGAPGPWLITYTYDGLGRLIRTQRPWPAPSTTATLVRVEHFYYDGVRRVQEVFVDPLIDSETETKGVGAKDEEDSPPQPQTYTWVEREYIWGPDYVDELVAQVVPASTEVILYSLTGHAGTTTTLLNPTGTVQAQYLFDPYGEVLGADVSSSMPRNRVGHQGLFFDRLTGTALDQQLGRANVGVYYNRNRTYAPAYGRFLQRDLNGAGSPIQGSGSLGDSPPQLNAVFGLTSLYSGGLNIHAYVGSNPAVLDDPLGLDFNLSSTLLAAGVQGWIQGLVMGTVTKAMGGSFGQGFTSGFIGGAAGGAFGAMAGSAFAASATGLWATLATHSAVGGIDGGVAAFVSSMHENHGDIRAALADAAWGAAIGAATGGLGKVGINKIRALLGPQLASIKFSQGAISGLRRTGLDENNARMLVKLVLREGECAADPQGVYNTFMFRSTVWVNGVERQAEVLWNATKNEVWHVMVRAR